MRASWSRTFPRLRTTLEPATKESIVHRETRVNRIVLTKSSGQISRSWIHTCSYRRLALCFLTSMLLLTKASKFRLYVKLTFKVQDKQHANSPRRMNRIVLERNKLFGHEKGRD